MIKNIALLGLGFVLAGCGGEPPLKRSSTIATTSPVATRSVATESTAPFRSSSPDLLRDDLVEHGLGVPTGRRESVIAELSRPDSAHSRAVPNRHRPAQTDSIVDLFYPGLRLQYLIVAPGDTEFLEIAEVWDNRYLKYPTIGVGASAAAIVDALGKPWERTDDAYSYDCGRCIGAETPVYFHLEGGRVKFVEYTYYVD